jgi:outer membrane protein
VHEVNVEVKTRFHGKLRAIRIEEFKEFVIPMKRSFTAVCMLASAVGAGSIALTSHAAAQSAEPPSAPSPAGAAAAAGPSKVAVIVFQQAVLQTNEGQRNIAQIQTKFAPKQAQLKAQSDEIDSLKKQLQDSAATLSDQERETRTRTIDEKTKSLQRVAEDDQNDFNSEMGEAYQSLAQKVYAVMDDYSKQQGYTLVLDAGGSNQQNSPVLWVNPATDITKAVIEAYNVKSGVPAQPAGAATPTTPHTTRPSTTRPSTTKPSTTTP